jgi:predicted amidohydrolase YtcJ
MTRLYLDGAIIYSPGRPTQVGALIEAERFIAVGPKAAEAFNPKLDLHLDLTGKFLAPAFGDGHAHPLFAGREAAGPKVTGLTSLAEILAEIARFAEEDPTGWIVGGAYEASLIEGGDFDAHWIDEAVCDRPVVLHSVDHHTIWVNSKALEIAGISSSTIDPDGGSIARRIDGSPKGTLREPQAMDLILSKIPPRTMADEIAALRWACRTLLESGITFATDSWVEPGMAQIYREAHDHGVLTVDMNISHLVSPENWREESDRIISDRRLFDEIDSINASSVKFLADGALSSGTAALLEPYDDKPGFSGITMWSDGELKLAVKHFDALGFQVHIHSIGDAAVRQALDAIEYMQSENPNWDRRPVIVHAQLISASDLPRFSKLGVIANMQPLWMYLDPMNKELIAPRIGERNNQQYRLRDMIKAGVRIAYGSDWPITSEKPLLALGVPVHRTEPGEAGEPWSPHQSIDLEQSWGFYTEAVAYQNYREDYLGAIEVGMRADFIILDRNPFLIPVTQIHEIRIESVFKAGLKVI